MKFNFIYEDTNCNNEKFSIKWIDIDKNMRVFFKHKDLLEKVAKEINAHW